MFWPVLYRVIVQGFRSALHPVRFNVKPLSKKNKMFFIAVLFGVIIVCGWWMVRLTLIDCTFLTLIVLIPVDNVHLISSIVNTS